MSIKPDRLESVVALFTLKGETSVICRNFLHCNAVRHLEDKTSELSFSKLANWLCGFLMADSAGN